MGYKRVKKNMKKILILTIALLSMALNSTVSAQDRMKLYDGVYIVKYGNTYTIEDDNTKMCVSLSVAQEQIDYKNGKAVYEVVCNKWTRRVAKEALKFTITDAIKAVATGGSNAILKVAGSAAGWIYDDVCDYYEEKYSR